jgi:hypothetical protein
MVREDPGASRSAVVTAAGSARLVVFVVVDPKVLWCR